MPQKHRNRDRQRDPGNENPRPSKRDPRGMVHYYMALANHAVYDFDRQNALQHADHWMRVARGYS